MKRIGKGLLAGFAIAALVGACAKEQTSFVDTPRPGTPAYWDSEVPAPTSVKQPPAQATPAAGTYYPDWPALDGGVSTDPGPTSHNGAGTTDPYLWQKGSGTELGAAPPQVAVDPQGPESQVPLRNDDGSATESYTIVGDEAPVAGPPLRESDDPYADLDAVDAGASAAPSFATPPEGARPIPAKAIAVPGNLDPLPGPDGALP